MKLVEGLSSSNRGWIDGYFFVCGDNWEKLPEEGDDFIPLRRTWGVPSSSGVCMCISFWLYFYSFSRLSFD